MKDEFEKFSDASIAVSRRSAIALSGAALTLAGCGPGNIAGNSGAKTGPPIFSSKGFFDNHGFPPYLQFVSAFPGSKVEFKPTYGCAVYIKFHSKQQGPNSPRICTIRHGYFPTGVKTNDTRVDFGRLQVLAEAELQVARTATFGGGAWKRPHRPPTPGTGPRPMPTPEITRREGDFNTFTFQVQQLIYFIVDNDDVTFDDRQITEVKGSGSGVLYPLAIRFSQYRSLPTELTEFALVNAVAKENYAFFGATLVDAIDRNTFRDRRLLRLENWSTDMGGKPITYDPNNTNQHTDYSMNLHLLATGYDGSKIPLIIDPDTGNGYGDPPP